MANNYTQFSCALELGSIENVAAALSILTENREKFQNEPEHGWFGFGAEADGTALWIHSDDSGSPDDVLAFVAVLGAKLKLSGMWGFTWGDSCSKLRLDEFGGGAATINLKNGRVDWMNTYAWLGKRLKPQLYTLQRRHKVLCRSGAL